MSDSNPHARRELLLLRMEEDRLRLHKPPPLVRASDFNLPPVAREWLVPGGLFLLSMLRLPTAIKAPLRAAAVLMMRTRLTDAVRAASRRSERRSTPEPEVLESPLTPPEGSELRARRAPL